MWWWCETPFGLTWNNPKCEEEHSQGEIRGVRNEHTTTDLRKTNTISTTTYQYIATCKNNEAKCEDDDDDIELHKFSRIFVYT
jgi:hypothetical protein